MKTLQALWAWFTDEPTANTTPANLELLVHYGRNLARLEELRGER